MVFSGETAIFPKGLGLVILRNMILIGKKDSEPISTMNRELS
jgi:hypothetical protein